MRRPRSDRRDQAELIARELGMNFHFAPAMRVMEEEFGDAIMTPLPMRLVKADALPSMRFPVKLEPRGALWTEIDVGASRLQMMTTHLGLVRRERRRQAERLAGEDWLGHPACSGATVLAGDFNFLSRSRAYASITKRLQDSQRRLPGLHRPTFPARNPRFRIDYIFVSNAIEVEGLETLQGAAARIASDHLPLMAHLKIPLCAERLADAPSLHGCDHVR